MGGKCSCCEYAIIDPASISCLDQGYYKKFKVQNWVLSNAVASGSTVTSTGGGWGTSYAYKTNALRSSGDSVSFKLPFGTGTPAQAAVGLECGGFDARAIYSASSCFYWIYRHAGNTLYVKEKGTSFAGFSTTQISGIAINWNTDVFGMRLNSAGRVEYLHNGNVFRTANAQIPPWRSRMWLPVLAYRHTPGPPSPCSGYKTAMQCVKRLYNV